MAFWVHKGCELGGEVVGSYDTPEDAAQAIARIALEAFGLQDGIERSYRIIEAATKDEAEKKINAEYGWPPLNLEDDDDEEDGEECPQCGHHSLKPMSADEYEDAVVDAAQEGVEVDHEGQGVKCDACGYSTFK